MDPGWIERSQHDRSQPLRLLDPTEKSKVNMLNCTSSTFTIASASAALSSLSLTTAMRTTYAVQTMVLIVLKLSENVEQQIGKSLTNVNTDPDFGSNWFLAASTASTKRGLYVSSPMRILLFYLNFQSYSTKGQSLISVKIKLSKMSVESNHA